MADWRQIQARIRKAKTSTNPSAKLSELYLRTRDAMVAWELGAFEEKNGRSDEAIKWYGTAAQRFRRAEWKKKAEEALTRLGAEVPDSAAASSSLDSATLADAAPADTEERTAEDAAESSVETKDTEQELSSQQSPAAAEEITDTEITETAVSSFDAASESQPHAAPAAQSDARKRRRRGRRGGRGRHRKSATAPSLPSQAFAEPTRAAPATSATTKPRTVDESVAYPVSSAPDERTQARSRIEEREPEPQEFQPVRATRHKEIAPQLPSERSVHGRAGDPALASRMAQLESMLRRLLSSRLHRLDELEEAPAGPGVFLLSDSDQVTSYYVESCQTLRIGLGNLTRTVRSGKTHRSGGRTYAEIDIKGKFADHLGINQSKVPQYMKEHCVVRWIQMDDDAPHLAHFAIGVLRTPLNLE